MSLIDQLKSIMTAAHKRINTMEAAKEAEKVHTFRVGSSGALTEDNKAYYTQCGRLAQARYLGFQTPPTESMRAMFNGGLTLEDFIEQRVKIMNVPYEKEKQIEVFLTSEIKLSGRPDFLLQLDGEQVGIEVKSLASPFSVIKQRKNGFPLMKHMIQAATYMAALNTPKWLIAIGHSFHVRDKGLEFPPGVVWYEMRMDEEGNFIVKNDKLKERKLPFVKGDLIRYYESMKQGLDSKQLMHRPDELELNVDTYNRCNSKYCAMSGACNQFDTKQITFDEWMGKIPNSEELE